MRALVFGRTGQVGGEIVRLAQSTGIDVVALDRSGADLARPESLPAIVRPGVFDVVINAAAYTAVDKAESEPALAYIVNAEAPAALARTCRAHGLPLIHLSTDYVFDGTSRRPYQEDDAVGPISVYGKTKLAGEQAVRAVLDRHVIVRTSWIYSTIGVNFVKTMLRLGRTREEIAVVDDQRGCPTAAHDVARATLEVARQITQRGEGWGTYHFCGAGETSWHDFAASIFALAPEFQQRRPRLKRITTAEYPTAARRPAYSVLDCARIERVFAIKQTPWRGSLDSVLDLLAKAA